MLFGCIPLMKTLELQGAASCQIEVGSWLPEETVCPSSIFVLIEVLHGDGVVLRNGTPYEVKAPSFWVSIPSEVLMFGKTERWQLRVLAVDERIFESIYFSVPGDRALEVWRKMVNRNGVWPINFGPHNELHRLWNELEALRPDEENMFSAVAILWQMTAQMRYSSADEAVARTSFPSRRLMGSVRYMQENFNSKILLSDLAKIASMSVSNFSAVFHKVYGISPMEYLLQLRLRNATYLLQYSDEKIITIAEESGFFSNSNFIKAFTKEIGKTPSEYRKAYRRDRG